MTGRHARLGVHRGLLSCRGGHSAPIPVPGGPSQVCTGKGGIESPQLAALQRNQDSQPEGQWPQLPVSCKAFCLSDSMVLDKACRLFEPYFSHL